MRIAALLVCCMLATPSNAEAAAPEPSPEDLDDGWLPDLTVETCDLDLPGIDAMTYADPSPLIAEIDAEPTGYGPPSWLRWDRYRV